MSRSPGFDLRRITHIDPHPKRGGQEVMMLVGCPLDFGLTVRGRRNQLKLRQLELAKAVGVGRDWIIDLERGRDGLDFSRVLRTLEILDIEISVNFCKAPPAWSIPFAQDAAIRRRRIDAMRPRRKPKIAPLVRGPTP